MQISTSNWARKESALTEAEQKAVDSYGLFDLNDQEAQARLN